MWAGGRPRFFVYGTGWFTALAVLLAVNVLAALLVRFPWKRRQTGFVLTHVGLLVLLLGCLLTRRRGSTPSCDLRGPGGTDRHARLLALRDHPAASAAGTAICVPFDPGPLGWDAYPRLLGFFAIAACSMTATASAWKRSIIVARGTAEPFPPAAARVRLTVSGAAEEF